MTRRAAAGLRLVLVLVAVVGGLTTSARVGAQEVAPSPEAATCAQHQVTANPHRWYSLSEQAFSRGGGRFVYSTSIDPSDYPHPVIGVGKAAFLHDAASGSRRRIDSPLFEGGRSPSISADGRWVVLSAHPQRHQEFVIFPTGFEAYLYEVESGRAWTLSPLRDELEGTAWAITDDGARMLVLAHDPYTVVRRMWVYDRPSGTRLRIPQGVKDLSPDGTTVLVSSWQDPTGQNPDRGPELFLFDIATFAFTQLTDRPEGADPSFERAEFTDGGHVLYSATDDPFGTNTDGTYESFLLDRVNGSTAQLTDVRTQRWYAQQEAIAPDGSAAALTTQDLHDGPNSVMLLRGCGAAPAPDVQVGPVGGPLVGDGVRWAVARPDQLSSASVDAQTSTTFVVRVQNDRTAADSFTLATVEGGAPGYVTTVRRAGTDVTAAVRAGTYRVGPLAPGAAVDLEVRVTAATAAGGSTHTVDLTARSVANPIARDTVRAQVQRR